MEKIKKKIHSILNVFDGEIRYFRLNVYYFICVFLFIVT